MWWIYALLSAFFASCTALFAKLGVKDVNADLATALRTVIILIVSWGIAFYRGGIHSFNALSRQSLLFIALSGLATGLSWIFYFKALKAGSVSQVAPVDKLSVALTLVFAALFLGEAISFKTAIGAGLIVTGTIVLIL
jgi:transporter family protein